MTSARPFVLINMAMSADGKIAPPHRRFIPIGSRRDHDNLLRLRTTADAVMCGARTVESGNITMDAGGARYERQRLAKRLAVAWPETKTRIGEFRFLKTAASVSTEPEPLINTRKFCLAKRLAKLKTVADEVIVCGAKSVALGQALGRLRRDWKVKRLLCEGGGELNFELLRLGLVDELHLTICPRLIGGRDAPTIADGAGFQRLAKAAQLELTAQRLVGDELFTAWRVRPKSR